MKITQSPPIPERVVDQVRALAQSGASTQQLIQHMRDRQLGIITSIRLLAEILRIPTSEAKRAVHFSSTWADTHTANECVHERAVEAAHQLEPRKTRIDRLTLAG